MKQKILFIIFLLLRPPSNILAQNLKVETILNLDASGGLVMGDDGNIYISDFGSALGTPSSNTKVYQVEYGTWNVKLFASGFTGASGSIFDSQGNFFQANPSGGRVSKRLPGGKIDLNWATGLHSPIGITKDSNDTLYVCNCGDNTIQKISPAGKVTEFASSTLFNCPNGITMDTSGNLYVSNFSDGKILKITPSGLVDTFVTLPVYGGIGNGHVTYSNGFLFSTAIGVGAVYKISLAGVTELIAGQPYDFSNVDGSALSATFSKPNGIVASITGDTLFVNTAIPTWSSNSNALHPGLVRMITGVCSLPDVNCRLLSGVEEITPHENQLAILYPPAPNPSKLETKFTYEIHETPQTIQLEIISAHQQQIEILENGNKNIGTYEVKVNTETWDAGIYYCILKGKGYSLTQKLIVTK